MKIEKDLESRIINYCKKNPIELYYDYRDTLEKDTIIKMLEADNGMQYLEEEVWENSIDYICELENEFTNNVFDEMDIDRDKSEDENDIIELIRDHTIIDLNIKQLLRNTGDIDCIIPIYSNYDCCNSFNDPKEPDSYLSDVYSRVKAGVKRAEYEYEFYNGAYGGSLFCFVFKTDIETLMDLKKQMKDGAKYINIPKGTQFGFFSSFQGSASIFERVTYRNMKLRIDGKTEYETVDIIADVEQSYSLRDVFGGGGWMKDQNITLTGKEQRA